MQQPALQLPARHAATAFFVAVLAVAALPGYAAATSLRLRQGGLSRGKEQALISPAIAAGVADKGALEGKEINKAPPGSKNKAVEIEMTITNVNSEKLLAEDKVKAGVIDSIQKSVADHVGNGLKKSDVIVRLKKGSVIADTFIKCPQSMSADAVSDYVKKSGADLAKDVANNVGNVKGIDTAALGQIAVDVPSMVVQALAAIPPAPPPKDDGFVADKAKKVTADNPLKNPVGDYLGDAAPPRPKGTPYVMDYVPHAPPSDPDISGTDFQEQFDGWEGTVADAINGVNWLEGRIFRGPNCQSVCQHCVLRSSQWGGSEGNCYCKAECKAGACPGGVPHIGWTDNTVTAPREMWQARCNIGRLNCEDECLKDDFLKKLHQCQNITNDARPCYHKLELETAPAAFDARNGALWCTRKGLKTCDTFLTYPTTDGWQCFRYKDKCDEKALQGFKVPYQTQQAPSVWNSLPVGG